MQLRDEDGYLEGGDLVSGGYGAIEGDLGETLRKLAGFGRDIEPAGSRLSDASTDPQEGLWDEDEEGTYVLPGGFSTGLPAAYTLRGWESV